MKRTSSTKLPTKYGDFKAMGYKSLYDDDEHVALVRGDINSEPTLVRVHSECLSGDFWVAYDAIVEIKLLQHLNKSAIKNQVFSYI